MTAVDTQTGELLQACTADEARDLTERMRSHRDELWRLAIESHDRQAWKALGYPSWREYIEAEVGVKSSQAYRLLDHGRTMLALAAADSLDTPMGERADSPIGERQMPTHESQTRPLAKLPEQDRRDAWTDAVEQAESEGRSPTARDVEQAVERRQPVKTTVTERITETRQTVTEPSPGHPAAPADERSEVEGSPTRPPSDRTSDDDTEAINRGFRNAVDPDLDYRKRFTDALTRAHDVTQFDADRAIATGGESAGTNRHLVKSLADWCDAYLKATRPTHLRSAK